LNKKRGVGKGSWFFLSGKERNGGYLSTKKRGVIVKTSTREISSKKISSLLPSSSRETGRKEGEKKILTKKKKKGAVSSGRRCRFLPQGREPEQKKDYPITRGGRGIIAKKKKKRSYSNE